MKSTTILLDEDLLLEVQRLAEGRHTTASQIIQQAVAEYLEGQRRDALTAPILEEQWSGVVPPDSLSEPIDPLETESDPVLVGQRPSLTEGAEEAARPAWVMWAPFVFGGLGALSALVLLVLAVGHLADRGRPIEVVANYLLPGILLGVVAAGSFFVASQSRQAHHAEREDSEI